MFRKILESTIIILLILICGLFITLINVPSLRSQVAEIVGVSLKSPTNDIWYPWPGDATNGAKVEVAAITVAGGSVLPVNTSTSSTFTTNQIPIYTTSAGLIRAINTSRKSIIIRNQGGNNMYIGPTIAITTSTGLLMLPNESVTLDRTTAAIYGRAITGTTWAGYLEE